MPVIKPIISGTSVRSATSVPIIAEEDLLIGDPVALFYKPNEYYEVPYEDIGVPGYYTCTFSPDNSLLVLYLGTSNNPMSWPVIYDVNSKEVLPTPEVTLEDGDSADNCVFSPDGKQLAISCYDEYAVYLYDTTTRPFTFQAKLPCTHQAILVYNHSGTRLCVTYSGTGTRLDGSWGIYDTKTFARMTNPIGFGYSAGNVSIRGIAYSSDDSQMAIQYDVYRDDAWKHCLGIFDNRGLTPTLVASYMASTYENLLGNIFYSPDDTLIYNYYTGWNIFSVTPTDIERCSTIVAKATVSNYPIFLPTEQLAVVLEGYIDLDGDADATEDVAIGTFSLTSEYVYEYSLKIIVSSAETKHSELSVSPDGSLIFASYRLDGAYAMRIYKMEWFAKKANYKTQQFAQAIGYAANNIKTGQTGSAIRII